MPSHRYSEFIERKGYQVICCEDCRYWHVHPMPTEKKLEDYYQKYYSQLGDNRTMTDKQHDPDGFYRLQYEDRLRLAEALIPKDLTKRVLDIGAGYGDFLRFMREKGWQTQGIEPSLQALSLMADQRKLNVQQGHVDAISRKNFAPASLITLNNVLEHVAHPQQILTTIRRESLLLPDGVLLIIVPNDFNPLQDILRRSAHKDFPDQHYYWVGPPTHLNYWSIPTLKDFVRRCGFQPVHCTADFPMEIFALMGENYLLDPQKGRPAHLKRVQFEKNLHRAGLDSFKDKLFASFADLGIGRDTLLYCVEGRKP